MQPAEKLSITLPSKLASMVRDKVDAGTYSSNSEVIREALRLLEEKDRMKLQKLEVLRAEITKGIESGSAGDLDFKDLRQKAKAQLNNEKK